MWNNILLIGFLVAAASMNETHGEGYPKYKPDNPLELPAEGSTGDSSVTGYPKVVPEIPFQTPSESELNPDRLPFGTASEGVTDKSKVIYGQSKKQDKGKYDHNDDGTGWDIRKSIPGEPDKDYPVYDSVPSTTFTCADKVPGYYADLESRCQAFRVCTTGSVNAFNSFLCPNGSLFNQAVQTCDWWQSVDCENSYLYYYKNNEIQSMPEGSQLMYEIQKMLQVPSLEEQNDNSLQDNQIQESETYNDLSLPPVEKSTTTRKYYSPTVPSTTPQSSSSSNVLSTQTNTYPTTTGAYSDQQHIVQSPEIIPPSTGYLPPEITHYQTADISRQPEYVTPEVFIEQQKPTLQISQVGDTSSSAHLSQSPKINELHLSPKLHTTPPLQVSNTPATLKVSQVIKAKLPHPLYVSELVTLAPPINPNTLKVSQLVQAKVPQPLLVSEIDSPKANMKPFTSRPTPQAPNIPQNPPKCHQASESASKLENEKSFLSQIGQSGTTGQGYDTKFPSITITKEQSHSVNKTQGTTITQTSGQGPQKVSLLNVQQPIQLPVQKGQSDLRSNVGQTDLKLTINAGDLSRPVTPVTVKVPGAVTTITKEEAVQNFDNIRTELQQTVPQGEIAEGDLTGTVINSTQGNAFQDGVLQQNLVQKGDSQAGVIQGSILQSGITQQDTSKITDSGEVKQEGISQGLLQGGVLQENKIQEDVTRLLQTLSQGIPQDSTLPAVSQSVFLNANAPAQPYFGEERIDIRFKEQQSQAQPNTNDAFGISKSLELPYTGVNQQGFGFETVSNAGGFQDYASVINQGIQTSGQNLNYNPIIGYQPQGFQSGYIGVQGINPHYHEENIQNYNYHTRNNAQNVNYEQLTNERVQKYRGESISQQSPVQNPNVQYQSHSSYSGQNVAFKEKTKVQIVPSLGFTLTEDLGRQSYVTALLSGLIGGKTNFETLPNERPSTGEIQPIDVRFSSYQGPSSYLAPQASVERLPSNTGYTR